VLPFLASNYTVSPDGITYNITIRQGITFSNGDPLNAYVEWFSIYRTAVMNQEPSGYVTLYMNTSGVTAVQLNEFNTTNNVPPSSLMQIMQQTNLAVTVLGPYELQFHLLASSGSFLTNSLTQAGLYPVDPHVVMMHGGVQFNTTNDWMANNAVGTGPFMVSSFQPNTQITFQANPTYWGGVSGIQPTPKLKQVIIKVVPDDLTRLLDIEKGSAQLTTITFADVPSSKNSSSIYIPPIGTTGSINYLGMDTQKFPTNITLVREAIAYAINQTAALQPFYGLGTPFVGPNIQGNLGYNSSATFPSYNLTMAKALLAQAGYPNGQGIPQMTMVVPNNRPPAVDVAQVLQADLAAIGIQVNLQEVPAAQRNQLISTTNPTDPAYPNFLYMTLSGTPDPDQWLPYVVGPQGLGVGVFNSAQFNNSQINALIHQQSLTADLTQRAALEGQITTLVNKDLPYYWIAQFKNAYLTGVPAANNVLQGFSTNPIFIGGSDFDFSTLYLTSST